MSTARADLATSRHGAEPVEPGMNAGVVILSRRAKERHRAVRGLSVGMTTILHLPASGGHLAQDDNHPSFVARAPRGQRLTARDAQWPSPCRLASTPGLVRARIVPPPNRAVPGGGPTG